MPGIQSVGQGGQLLQVDATHRAARFSVRPIDHGTLGHYRVAPTTGILAAALAANSQIFQFKWTDATRLAVVTWVHWKMQVLTAFTAATTTDLGFDLFKVTAYALGGGGTTLGAPSKMKSDMGTSLVGGIFIATTAALTAATTLDANPIATSVGKANIVNAAAGTEYLNQGPPPEGFLNIDIGHGEYPLVLVANEGFVLRNRTVWPAAGTAEVFVEVAWIEVASFNNAQLG